MASSSGSGQASPSDEEQLDLTEDPADSPFSVRLNDQRGSVPIKLRPSTKLSALVVAYAERRALTASSLRLVQGNQSLDVQGTAAQAGLTADSVLGCLQVL